MSTQIENAIALVRGLAAQAVNHAAGNKLHRALTKEDPADPSPLALLKARKMLGQTLDASQIPAIVDAIGAQIDAYNAAVVIQKPTLEEIVAAVNAGVSQDSESE